MSTPQHTPADIVTYRLHDKMVYVVPATDYEQALEYAKKVFPELQDVPHDRISFCVNSFTRDNTKRTVEIADMAWQVVVSTLKRYEIIEIRVQPESIMPPPPRYLDATAAMPPADLKEGGSLGRAKSCPPSPPTLAVDGQGQVDGVPRAVSPARSIGANGSSRCGWKNPFRH